MHKVWASAVHAHLHPSDFAANAFKRRRFRVTFVIDNRRRLAVFDNQLSRKDQRRDLDITETVQQAPHVSVDGLRPYVFTRIEIPTDQRDVDPRVNRGCVKRDQRSFAVTGDTDRFLDLGAPPDGVREIAAYADTLGIEIVMENNNAYWGDLDDDVRSEDVDWSGRNGYFGMAPEEWIDSEPPRKIAALPDFRQMPPASAVTLGRDS